MFLKIPRAVALRRAALKDIFEVRLLVERRAVRHLVDLREQISALGFIGLDRGLRDHVIDLRVRVAGRISRSCADDAGHIV